MDLFSETLLMMLVLALVVFVCYPFAKLAFLIVVFVIKLMVAVAEDVFHYLAAK